MPQSAKDDAVRLRDAAAEQIRSRSKLTPNTALILGSGLTELADQLTEAIRFSFEEIPGFATATASGHRGELIIGRLCDQTVIAMAGRLHRYEGHDNDDIVFPVHVMAELGADALIVSNAAGGLNATMNVGEIVVIRDHINRLGGSQLAFPAASALLTRRGAAYDEAWSQLALAVARSEGFAAREGTYLATLGPNYETRAEYRMMRRLGADVVGMSTVPEVLAAQSLEMRVLGLSMVSNVANPDRPGDTNHAEVLEAGRAAAAKMESIVRAVLLDRNRRRC